MPAAYFFEKYLKDASSSCLPFLPCLISISIVRQPSVIICKCFGVAADLFCAGSGVRRGSWEARSCFLMVLVDAGAFWEVAEAGRDLHDPRSQNRDLGQPAALVRLGLLTFR